MVTVTNEDLRIKADRLLDALDAYDRFVEGWLQDSSTAQAEVRAPLTDRDGPALRAESPLAESLVGEVTNLYYEVREAEATYVQQAREQGQSDWVTVVAATEPVRKAARRVHMAGYGIDPKTGQKDYLLPTELCPARRVSMNDDPVWQSRRWLFFARTTHESAKLSVIFDHGV